MIMRFLAQNPNCQKLMIISYRILLHPECNEKIY